LSSKHHGKMAPQKNGKKFYGVREKGVEGAIQKARKGYLGEGKGRQGVPG